MVVENAPGGALNLFDEAVKVIAGARDSDYADGGRLPHDGLIHLGDGDVETLAQLVFEGTHYLAPVLEGLGVLDANFECQLGNGHDVEEIAGTV
jgi:hypothetical protein